MLLKFQEKRIEKNKHQIGWKWTINNPSNLKNNQAKTIVILTEKRIKSKYKKRWKTNKKEDAIFDDTINTSENDYIDSKKVILIGTLFWSVMNAVIV